MAPATAVASSKRKNSAPRSSGAEIVDLHVLPVGAVRRLTRRRHEPPALLARRLGEQLLEPQSETPGILEDDLVAPLLPARPQREAELETGILVGEPAGVVHLLGARKQPGDVDAGERRGTSPNTDSAE